MYGNITEPPTTPPPSPPPSRTSPPPSQTPTQGYYPNYPPSYSYYSPFSGYGYGAWQSPPFGPPPIYVMPPVWPSGYGYGAPIMPIIMPTTPMPTTPMPTTPTTESGVTRESGVVRKSVTDSGKVAEWWWPTDRPFSRPSDMKYVQGVGFVRPSAYELAASIQGYPLNEAAYGQFMDYYREMWDRYTKPSLPKISKEGPPEWYKDLGYEEPEWWKDIRSRTWD
jgi:hypothetical protein